MKATGIVRRIDDLGRVVIPKEIRRTMRIREGDPLEIYTEKDGELIFKKYSPVGELSTFAGQICDSLHKVTEQTAIVCDRDNVIAAAGGKRRELLEKPVSLALERLMEQRGFYCLERGADPMPVMEGGTDPVLSVAAPILAEGDVLGCVAFVSSRTAPPPGEVEAKLAQTAAGFLGRQMES